MTRSWRSFSLITLLVLLTLMCVVYATVITRLPRPVGAAETPFVGTWVQSPSDSPGVTKRTSFNRDGTFRILHFSDSTSAVLQNTRGRWRIENSALVLWLEDDKLTRRLLGYPTDVTPISLLEEGKFTLSTDGETVWVRQDE